MKTYLRPKPYRLDINTNMVFYVSLTLIIMGTLLTMMVPLFRQPIPLHALAGIKSHEKTIAPIIITIGLEDEYRLNTELQPEQLISLAALKEAIRKQFKIMDPKETSICINSDPAVPYGKVIELLDWLHALGAKHVGLLLTTSLPQQK